MKKQSKNASVLIEVNSPQVGIKIQRIEEFIAKYGIAMHEWLLQNHKSVPEENISNGGSSLNLQSTTVPIMGSAIHIVRQIISDLGSSNDFSENLFNKK